MSRILDTLIMTSLAVILPIKLYILSVGIIWHLDIILGAFGAIKDNNYNTSDLLKGYVKKFIIYTSTLFLASVFSKLFLHDVISFFVAIPDDFLIKLMTAVVTIYEGNSINKHTKKLFGFDVYGIIKKGLKSVKNFKKELE